jgi:hypothetical protein
MIICFILAPNTSAFGGDDAKADDDDIPTPIDKTLFIFDFGKTTLIMRIKRDDKFQEEKSSFSLFLFLSLLLPTT